MTKPSILFRLMWRYISRRFLQSVLFIIGIALGVAMVVAIDIANTSSSRAFALSTESVTGRATHQIIGGASGLPSDLYRQLRVDLGLNEVAPVVESYVLVNEFADQPMHILGVDPFAEPPFRDYFTITQSTEGETQNVMDSLNVFIVTPNSVLISAVMSERYDVPLNATITLRPPSGAVQATVVGILQTDDPSSNQALESLIMMDIASAQEILQMEGRVNRIDLILPDGYPLEHIEALLPNGAFITTPLEQSSALSQMTDAFEVNLQALSLLALVVGVFLIYNTVTFSVVQRRGVLGVLRALGTTRQQIFTLIIGESFLLGIFGTVLGIGLGILFGRSIVGLIGQTISDLYFTVNVNSVSIDSFTFIKAVSIGLASSILAAFIPSYDATQTPPTGSLRRSSLEEITLQRLPYVTLGAIVLLVLGMILLSLQTDSLIVSFGALFCIIGGGAFLTPLVLIVMTRALIPITSRLFGILGKIAPRAIIRSLSRTSVAVAALTVAVSVIVGVSLMISSFRTTVADWLDITLGADIYISSPELTGNRTTVNVAPALADAVASVEGVSQVFTVRTVTAAAPDYPELPPVNLTVSNGDATGGQRRFVWLSVPTDDYFSALNTGAVLVSEPFAFRRGITETNNQITLLTDQGEVTFPVLGVFYDYTTDQGSVVMTDVVYQQYFDDPFISTLSVMIEPEADLPTVLTAIREEALRGTEMLAQSNRDLRNNVFEVFDRTFAVTAALRLLAMIVAFIGILSALMSLQLEQTRQFGVLRAVGMTAVQLWNYTFIQTGIMGLIAGLCALPIGAALAWVLIYVINVRSFGWTMQMSITPADLLLAFGVALSAALVAGIYPAYRLSKLITATALRSE